MAAAPQYGHRGTARDRACLAVRTRLVPAGLADWHYAVPTGAAGPKNLNEWAAARLGRPVHGFREDLRGG